MQDRENDDLGGELQADTVSGVVEATRDKSIQAGLGSCIYGNEWQPEGKGSDTYFKAKGFYPVAFGRELRSEEEEERRRLGG